MDKPETISKAIVIKRESPTDLFFRFVPSSSSSYVPNTLICIFNIKVYIYTSVGELVYGMAPSRWRTLAARDHYACKAVKRAPRPKWYATRNAYKYTQNQDGRTRASVPRFQTKIQSPFFYINQIKEPPAAAVA